MAQYGNPEALTEVSARQWAFVTQENLSPREAVVFLLSGMQLRTFRDVLRQVCGREDLEQQLVKGLQSQSGGVQPDSIRRKVRTWMSGKSIPTEREDVFQICFALGLELEQTEKMLSALTEQGIHYRNVRETVYAYCLRYHLGYAYAQELSGQFAAGKQRSDTRDPVTHIIRQDFLQIRAQEDLFTFLLRHREEMGEKHNTAYAYFTKMLSLLTGEGLSGEERYTMEYVADTYLRLNVPQDKKTGQYGDVQKMVKKYWPGARSIKAMHCRSEDVSRKTLLLLYLVTGGVWDQEYDELDEAYIQPREFLETHCTRMNHMLSQCGMRPIDPRNAFDYLVLYCLRPEEKLFMSDRMAALAEELFRR